jgi:hypothetical protein
MILIKEQLQEWIIIESIVIIIQGLLEGQLVELKGLLAVKLIEQVFKRLVD